MSGDLVYEAQPKRKYVSLLTHVTIHLLLADYAC